MRTVTLMAFLFATYHHLFLFPQQNSKNECERPLSDLSYARTRKIFQSINPTELSFPRNVTVFAQDAHTEMKVHQFTEPTAMSNRP